MRAPPRAKTFRSRKRSRLGLFCLPVPRPRLLATRARPVAAVEEEPIAPPSPRVDLRDGIGAIGLLLLVAGVWQIYVAAAWIVLGGALLLIAWRV